MSKSYSKIRHMQESNLRLEGRLISEQFDASSANGVSPVPSGFDASSANGVSSGQGNKPVAGKTTAVGVAPPVSGQGVKVITPKITIDCAKRLIISSQLPKLADNASNLTMNQGLVNHYCQAGK